MRKTPTTTKSLALAIPLLSALVAALTHGSDPAPPVATITVAGAERAYRDAIVSVALPASLLPGRPARLFEVSGGHRLPVPTQVDTSHGEAAARLWFSVAGDVPARSSRRYELHDGAPDQAAGVTLEVDPRAVRLLDHGNTMLQYNHAPVLPPAGMSPSYVRGAYIHPVFTPSGLLVTEDFPRDHPHHKGIWFPWTRTRFEGRELDFWNLRAGQATVQFAGFESVQSGPVFSGFRTRHQFVDLTQTPGGKVVLHETWEVRAWTGTDAYHLWDLTSTQRCATDSPLELLRYHYGGLGFRGARQWTGDNHVLLTSEGHTKRNGHTQRSRWVAHSGEIKDGRWATAVIMVHPENERFPEPMRIWSSGGAFFCYAPVQVGDWTLRPGTDYVFRYRFLVHDGRIDAEFAERMWRQFAEPLKAVINVEP